MRTRIFYFNRKLSPDANLAAALAFRNTVFDRVKHAMRRVRWVPTSAKGGYWTDES
jgi:hypothetical protein